MASPEKLSQPVSQGRLRADTLRGGIPLTDEVRETEVLLGRAAVGDAPALAELFERHRHRLEQMIRLRPDRRLQGRLDPADVLQEAYLE
jgi:hypothetical protein